SRGPAVPGCEQGQAGVLEQCLCQARLLLRGVGERCPGSLATGEGNGDRVSTHQPGVPGRRAPCPRAPYLLPRIRVRILLGGRCRVRLRLCPGCHDLWRRGTAFLRETT